MCYPPLTKPLGYFTYSTSVQMIDTRVHTQDGTWWLQASTSRCAVPSKASRPSTVKVQAVQQHSQNGGNSPRTRLAPSNAVFAPGMTAKYPPTDWVSELNTDAATDITYDAIIVGAGVGGLSAAAQMVAKGAKVLVLEK